eukprot:8062305-Pyramimonas_sp.AAC.1
MALARPLWARASARSCPSETYQGWGAHREAHRTEVRVALLQGHACNPVSFPDDGLLDSLPPLH